ncbi:MAG: ABC transporter permease subunit [Chloroflexota bacterium]
MADVQARVGGLARPDSPSVRDRLIGLGSVFAKTLRDSRRPTIAVAALSSLFMVVTAAAAGTQFPTLESRQELVAQMRFLPEVFRGLLGDPIAIDRLGGFLSWRVGNILPVMIGIWSVLALSGTIAGEARRGSLDLLVSTPVARRRIALEKVSAHVLAVAFTMLVAAIATTVAAVLFASLPGDNIPIAASLAHFTLTGLLMVAAGSVAFAAGPFVGRGRAAGLGFLVLFGGYLISSYASLSPVIGALKPVSWYAWTAGHRPMAGVTDWLSVALVALVTVVLVAIGLVGFERRDIGSSGALAWLRLPSLPSGTGGPFRRQLSDRAGFAIGWGLGIGLYGLLIAASADAFAKALSGIKGIEQMIAQLYPGIDIHQPAGILQLAFFSFGLLLFGLAGASFAAGWASDETQRRLDVVLSTPASRGRWALRTGAAVQAAVALVGLLVAAFIAVGTIGQGRDGVQPAIGIAILTVYAMAFTGVGLAAGGWIRPNLAAMTAGGLVVVSYLLESIGVALRLPDPILSLSLFHDVGQPIVGRYDLVGLLVATVLAIGGVIVAAIGLRRRDVGV